MWATAGAAREPWLGGVKTRTVTARGDRAPLRLELHTRAICAEAGSYHYAGADELLARENPLLVALDQVQDPQNLGSICRTAECAGAAGVVIPERRAAEVTPAVCKASAGAVEHLPVARVRNLADFLADARRAGCWCYGASAEGADGRPADLLRRAATTAAPGWCWCSAARAADCARVWRARATS